MFYNQVGIIFSAYVGKHFAELNVVQMRAPIDFPIFYSGIFAPKHAFFPVFVLLLRGNLVGIPFFPGSLCRNPKSGATPSTLDCGVIKFL